MISDQVLDHMRRTMLANRWHSPSEVVVLLKTKSITVSLSTIKRLMRREGLRQYVARQKPLLTDKAKATRLAYAREHLMDGLDSWRRTICCDEAAIRFNYMSKRFVTRYQGEEFLGECLAPMLLSSKESIMLWGAVWYGGRSELVLFDTSASTGKRGGVTSAIYCDQITSGPLKAVKLRVRDIWRGYGRPRILEDNAPIHTSSLNRSKGQSLNLSFINHPPLSPDLNPIEHTWSMLKRRMSKLQRQPNTLQELFIAAQACWHDIPQQDIDNCIDSMGRRLQAVINASGGPTKY